MQTIKTIAKNFVNLLYPMHCYGCNKPLEAANEYHACDFCIASIKQNVMPPFEAGIRDTKIYSACLYEGTLKELIHKFKYRAKTALSKILSKFMIDYIKENPILMDIDMITVVPLHKKRLREREFNQSLLLASPISKEFGIPTENMLEKIRQTKYQNELLRNERLKNLKDAFCIRNKSDVQEKKILLIDDVITTGATLSECSKTLLIGGAKSVTCLTLARGL